MVLMFSFRYAVCRLLTDILGSSVGKSLIALIFLWLLLLFSTVVAPFYSVELPHEPLRWFFVWGLVCDSIQYVTCINVLYGVQYDVSFSLTVHKTWNWTLKRYSKTWFKTWRDYLRFATLINSFSILCFTIRLWVMKFILFSKYVIWTMIQLFERRMWFSTLSDMLCGMHKGTIKWPWNLISSYPVLQFRNDLNSY